MVVTNSSIQSCVIPAGDLFEYFEQSDERYKVSSFVYYMGKDLGCWRLQRFFWDFEGIWVLLSPGWLAEY